MKIGFTKLFLLGVMISLCAILPKSEIKAQKITSSGFEDFDLNNSSLAFVAKRFNYYYFLKKTKEGDFILVFDTNMSKKAVVDLDFLTESNEAYSILSNRDGFVSYFKTKDRKDSTVIQRVEMNDYLRMYKRPTNVDTISEDLAIIDWVNSPSEEYTMAICSLDLRRSREGDELFLKIFNQQGDKLKEINIPDIVNLSEASLKIDNNGTIYFAQPAETAERITIWTSRINEKGLNQNFITKEPYLVNKMFLHQNPANNDMYFVTDFLKANSRDNTRRGFGFGKISPNAEINYHEVDNTDSRTLEKLFSGDNSFKLKFLNPVEDGGIIIGIEEYFEKQNTVSIGTRIGPGGTFSRVEYEYQLGDIHLMLLDKEGKSVWDKVYKKKQTSKGDLDPSLSFGVINRGSSLTLYFNQLESNGKIILEGFKVYPDGEDREIFFVWKNAKKDYSFLVSKGVQISRTEAIVPVYSQGKLGLAKIDMD